ncbi:response regulator [Litorilituus lipolyticus]|uniref:diguanylate cyclase n=1 Tax=Litorilituus lipolyticus TaxID=2491017 RepID=A0A502L2K2_9GAMM|nr:response regulator [Litorilituus lipolyticus]TPH16471.1 response regulator [Litorilituus lipolyticus]
MVLVRDNVRKKDNSKHLIPIDKPILLIEDQESMLLMLKGLIQEKYKIEIHTASNYAQAKALLSKHRHEYYLAICDLHLPDAPNGEIVSLLNRANVKMITLTGTFGERDKTSILPKGVIDYIIKDSINAYEYVVELVGRLYNNCHHKVLVVDDSAISCTMIANMLTMQNFEVLVAEDGVQALEVYKNNSGINLIITDYHMPNMDGFTLTLNLRKDYSKEQLAIIGLSASGDTDLGAQFIKYGANDFLAKPIRYEELLCRVNQNISMLEYMEALRNAANRDFLTSLYNRRYFFSQGKQIFQQAIDNESDISVAMLDIDHFKQINDNYGHEAGDDLLIHFSEQLTEHFEKDLIARIGGEEFVILFDGLTDDIVIKMLNDFREKIAAQVITCDEAKISMTVSIGFNSHKEQHLDAMLKIADENLYKAKQSGRNQVVG